MNEKRLISRLKNKDKKALGELIEKYSSYVYTVVRNIAGQALAVQDIEEVCADCFVNLWKMADTLDENRPVSPYLAACARNCAKNKLRSMRPDYSCEKLFEDIVCTENIQESYEISQQTQLVTECLDGLSDDEQEIFVRFYYYGEKTSQISTRLGISEGTCKTKLCRTRGKLKNYLNERGYTK